MKRFKPPILIIILTHIILGVPLAALFHSILQFAYEPSVGLQDIFVFFFHFFLGTLVGSLILIPAYFLQSLLYLQLHKIRVRCSTLVFISGSFQACLVFLWALFVGIEPSLGGRFLITPPMIFAGFLVGAITAGMTCIIVSKRSESDQKRNVSRQGLKWIT